ncbi:hypothetical protein BS50DRAFT_636567 [Corynespora cassiicola Philippines]|uniref:Uncharacterized protein n=1 Tax=Corynespora cassiicola Philippines TaxID=1448308 RepID=A0A2T2NGI8_CORCC|nr:hypothetical protein BS50DRAFT_636567 [Corynespora cassiicola Philippines]
MASLNSPKGDGYLEHDVEVTVSHGRYLLIQHHEDVFSSWTFHRPALPFAGSDPSPQYTLSLILVYPVTPGLRISTSALRDFRTNTLQRDDVFQPDFCHNVVFYGSKEDGVEVEPGALEELQAWDVKTRTFLAGDPSNGPAANVTPGPYVSFRGKTWQPWRIYNDLNACFMTALNPSPNTFGG